MKAHMQTELQKYNNETSHYVSLLSHVTLAKRAGTFHRSLAVIYDFYNHIFIVSTVTQCCPITSTLAKIYLLQTYNSIQNISVFPWQIVSVKFLPCSLSCISMFHK